MPGSRVYQMGFDEGKDVGGVQQFALGLIGQDRIGQRWSYVQFTAALSAGQWVADYQEPIIQPVANADGELIIPTASLADADYVYRGSFGLISEGAGRGQGFVITGSQVNGANTHFSIQLIHDVNDVDSGTELSPAMAASSRIQLLLPGVVVLGVVASVALARGVVQTDKTEGELLNAANILTLVKPHLINS